MAKRLTDEDKDLIAEKYKEIGTYAGVARETGFSASTVKKYALVGSGAIKKEFSLKDFIDENYAKFEEKWNVRPLLISKSEQNFSSKLKQIQLKKTTKFFKIEESFYDKNEYSITMTDKFYDIVGSLNGGSYHLVKSELLEMSYSDYLLMAHNDYNGKNYSTGAYMVMSFSDKTKCQELTNLLNSKMVDYLSE